MVGMHGKVSAGFAIDKADLVIALGARFSDRVATDPNRFAPAAKIIHVDIDAAEINKNMAADDSIVSDAKTFLEAVLPFVKENKHPAWMAQIAEWKEKLDYRPKDDDSKLRPHQVVGAIADIAGDDAVIVTDVGQHQMWAAQYCRRSHPRQFLTSGGLGTMGYGYGAAIGAQVGCPDKKIVHITGDGSFHMNLNECCTAVSNQLPVVTVIMNNSVLGMVYQWQTMFYDKHYCSHHTAPQDRFREACRGVRCARRALHQLGRIQDRADRGACSGRCPTLIDCVIDCEERVLPMVPAGKSVRDYVID